MTEDGEQAAADYLVAERETLEGERQIGGK